MYPAPLSDIRDGELSMAIRIGRVQNCTGTVQVRSRGKEGVRVRSYISGLCAVKFLDA